MHGRIFKQCIRTKTENLSQRDVWLILFLAGEEHQAERLSRVNSCCCRGNWTECELAGPLHADWPTRRLSVGRTERIGSSLPSTQKVSVASEKCGLFSIFFKNLSGSQVSNATLNFIAQRKYNKTNKRTKKVGKSHNFLELRPLRYLWSEQKVSPSLPEMLTSEPFSIRATCDFLRNDFWQTGKKTFGLSGERPVTLLKLECDNKQQTNKQGRRPTS